MISQNFKIRKRFLVLLVVGAVLVLPKGLANWQKPIQPSTAGGPLTCLSLYPLDSSRFLIASGQQLFESSPRTWKEIWSQNDPGSPIQQILVSEYLPDHVFVLTAEKIFLGNLKNASWHLVYKDSAKPPLSFTVHPKNPNRWFLGTPKGLWETDNAGKTWFPSKIFSAFCPVVLLRFEGPRLFIADETSLHIALHEEPARFVFEVSQKTLEPQEEDLEPEIADENTSFLPRIHDLLGIKKNPQKFFLATQDGVFESLDAGHRWEPLAKSGLESAIILQLAYSQKDDTLYAATPRGVYGYDSKTQRWTKLFKGLAKDRTQSIAVLNEERLIAITKDGFVQYPLPSFQPESPEAGSSIEIFQPSRETLDLFKKLVVSEPTAREVQKKVIRYADVSNGKIKRWHALSRAAGALPSFSFGKNLDRSASITTYSGKYITGPEDVSRGWDADVSWDLGDMLYSSDQTSIDSREKMMVELRGDLLSEATRVYYERRRLQIDTVFNPSLSEQEHLERLLRMDELTSLLDGMTNGFFSKQLERIYQERPEFNKLWIFQQKDGGKPSTLNKGE